MLKYSVSSWKQIQSRNKLRGLYLYFKCLSLGFHELSSSLGGYLFIYLTASFKRKENKLKILWVNSIAFG